MTPPAFCALSIGQSVFLTSRPTLLCNPHRRVVSPAYHQRRSRLAITALAGPVRSTETDTPKKVFIDRLKALEKVRLIVRNEAGILESIADFSSLFFATIPSGEYANVIQPANNIDLHLLLDKFSGAKFEIASDRETVALTVFLQWDKQPEDISAVRIQAWKDIKADYVLDDSDTFFFD